MRLSDHETWREVAAPTLDNARADLIRDGLPATAPKWRVGRRTIRRPEDPFFGDRFYTCPIVLEHPRDESGKQRGFRFACHHWRVQMKTAWDLRLTGHHSASIDETSTDTWARNCRDEDDPAHGPRLQCYRFPALQTRRWMLFSWVAPVSPWHCLCSEFAR